MRSLSETFSGFQLEVGYALPCRIRLPFMVCSEGVDGDGYQTMIRRLPSLARRCVHRSFHLTPNRWAMPLTRWDLSSSILQTPAAASSRRFVSYVHEDAMAKEGVAAAPG